MVRVHFPHLPLAALLCCTKAQHLWHVLSEGEPYAALALLWEERQQPAAVHSLANTVAATCGACEAAPQILAAMKQDRDVMRRLLAEYLPHFVESLIHGEGLPAVAARVGCAEA